MNIFFDLIIYLLFLFICCYNNKISQEDKQIPILQRLNNLRGIFAIEIIIGHVIRYEKSLLYPMGLFMIISVAFFFFVSGFGMVVSAKNKLNYFDRFLIKKPLYLLVVAIIFFIFNTFIDYVHPRDFEFIKSDENILSIFLNRTNWYILELIIIYIVFWITYKYIKKYQLLICTITLLILINIFFQCGFIQGWYSSTLAFPLGLLFGTYYEKVMEFLLSRKGVILTVLLSCIGMVSLLLSNNNIIGMVYLRNIICIAGILILVYIVSFIDIGNNKICKWLTKYSLELYLSQFIYLKIFNFLSYELRMIATILCCLVTSIVLHPVIKYLKKYLFNKCV